MDKNRLARVFRPRLISVAVASCFVTGAFANPTGPTVVHGTAAIHQAGNLLKIINSPNAIINWSSFSIGANEITRFIQQSQASAVLNRVTGAGGAIDPSVILGALQSNGRVFLINPSGVLFGAGAQVDVAGLVATSLNLSNADFLSNRLQFGAVPGAGSVVNQGNITTGNGGSVYLVGPAVANHGLITTPGGEVVLAAGNSVELVNPGTPNLRVEVSAADNEARNLGKIVADSGRIGIYAGLVNQSGTLRANSAQATPDGRIVLKAVKSATLEAGSVTKANGASGGSVTVQSGDTTLVAGTVKAKGWEGEGGTVQVLGNLVGLVDEASIDASGKTGGGTVLVGGDFQGTNPEVQNAYRTYVGPDAVIRADAITSGDGGNIIVWSDDATRFYGDISAKGGRRGGDGGFAEVSGRNWLDYRGTADLSAPRGDFGTLLLDPADVTISNGPEDSLPGFFGGIFSAPASPTTNIHWDTLVGSESVPGGQLGSSHVAITTSDGNISVLDGKTYNHAHHLSLVASGNVTIQTSDGQPVINEGVGDIRLFAGWSGIALGSPDEIPGVSPGSGYITLTTPLQTGGTVMLVAGNSIFQGMSAPVTANKLIADALGGTVDMGFATNMVNTVAGSAGSDSMPGGAFHFKNGKDLTIGSVPMGAGTRDGITVDGAEGFPALINVVVAGAGNSLTVSNDVVANAYDGCCTSQDAVVTLTAPNGITVNNSARIAAIAAGGFDGGEQSGAATVVLAGGSGPITVQAGTNIEARGGDAKSSFQSGGDAIITLTGGTVSVSGGSVLAAGGQGGSGGESFSFNDGGRGGDATISLTGNTVTVNGGSTLQASGGAGGGAFSGNGGRGGDAQVALSGNNITVAGVGTLVSATGGSGGGEANNLGGRGGHATVMLNAANKITVSGSSEIEAQGGSGGSAASSGGRGGDAKVELYAGPGGIQITGGAAEIEAVAGDGGSGESQSGRRGYANVEIRTGGPASGNVQVAASGVRADGAEGGVFIQGASVTLTGGIIEAYASDSSYAAAIGIDAEAGNITSDNTHINAEHLSLFGSSVVGLHASGNIEVSGATIGAYEGSTALVGLDAGGSLTVTGTAIEATTGQSAASAIVAIQAGSNINLSNATITAAGPNASALVGLNAGGSIIATNTTIEAISAASASAVVGLQAGANISLSGGVVRAIDEENGPALVAMRAGNNVTLGGNVVAEGGAGSPGWFSSYAESIAGGVDASVPADASGIVIRAGNRINGGSGVLEAESTQSIRLRAVNGIGSVATPVRIEDVSDATGVDLSLHNSGLSGDIAVMVMENDVTISEDLIGTFNNNPNGTYFVRADGGNFILNTGFLPGLNSSSPLKPGQKVIVEASGDVLIGQSGSIETSGAGSTSLKGENVVSTGALKGLLHAEAVGGDIDVRQGAGFTLGRLTATDGEVIVVSNSGAIADGNAGLNIDAIAADLRAAGGIGSVGNPLETRVEEIHLKADGGQIGIANTGGPLTLDSLDFNGSSAAVGTTGALTLGSDISINATGSGSLPGLALVANNGFTVDRNITVTGGGGVLLESGNGALFIDGVNVGGGGSKTLVGASITQAGGNLSGLVIADATNGSVFLQQPGNYRLGRVSATGQVVVSSGGTIIDGNAGANIIAPGGAFLTSGSGIGAGNPLETQTGMLYLDGGSGGVEVVNSGDLVLLGLASGTDASLATTGALTLAGGSVSPSAAVESGGASSGGNLTLGASGGMKIAGSVQAGGNLLLNAGSGSLDIAADAAAGNVSVGAGGTATLIGADVNLGSATQTFSVDVHGQGGMTIDTGNLTVQGGNGGSTFVRTSTGNMSIVAAGDVTVAGGTAGGFAHVLGTPDLDMNVGGQVHINATDPTAPARIESSSPLTITLTFPQQSAGSFFVNGQESVVADPDLGTGFYAGAKPAVLGENLVVTYGLTPVADDLPSGVIGGLNQVVTATNDQGQLITETTGGGDDGSVLGVVTDEKRKKQGLPVCN